MVTDPQSIPNTRTGCIVWAVCIALFTFILRNYFFLSTAVFWALFAIVPLTILIDTLWFSPKFSWLKEEEKEFINSRVKEKKII
jgi:Na+-transporting NADH:ubiquinone oxidoreductase subunit NqrB